MWSNIIYTKKPHRRPVQLTVPIHIGDPQQQLPVYWCIRCGGEIFTPGTLTCLRCKERRDRYAVKS